MLLLSAFGLGLSAHLLTTQPDRWPLTFLGLGVLLWLALLDGALVVKPAQEKRNKRPKVFCIGLSRTGTTSITVALKMLGHEAHHQCCQLVELVPGSKPRVDKEWADAFDATSDVAPATVLEELAEMYPDAKFVLTQRPPLVWGKAMIRFCSKHWLIFLVPIPPVKQIFDAIYGEGWAAYDEERWAKVYEAHEARVDKAFAKAPHRLLKFSIVGNGGWKPLCKFLGVTAVPSVPFPHADVFFLSAFTQAGWQLRRLWSRFGRRAAGLLLLLLLLRPCLSDHNQCTRACRVANGAGAPDVLGATGHWFDERFGGRRLWSNRSECECFAVGGWGRGVRARRQRTTPVGRRCTAMGLGAGPGEA